MPEELKEEQKTPDSSYQETEGIQEPVPPSPYTRPSRFADQKGTQPPYPPPYPGYYPGSGNDRPKAGFGRVFLYCLLAGVGFFAAAFSLLLMTSGISGTNIEEPPSDSSRVEASVEESSEPISIAPEVKPDIHGPQLSFTDTPDYLSEETLTASAAYAKASVSVVCITSYKSGGDYTLDASGQGSGIIITEDGYIATNSHVVEDSVSTGTLVTLPDHTQYLGTIIGIDKKTDLAVLKIDAKGLPAAELADSDSLIVGQQVFAIGSPGGAEFSSSLTKGALSALNRILSGSGYIKYIQTDAAINPGNSGGALINENGQVIGMNTAKLVATDYEGMGFAIPSNTVIEIVNKLIRYGYVNDRGTLGIEGKNCSLYMSKANKVPQGMLITKIDPKSPLADTQAKNGDIIIAVNGVTIRSAVEFIDEMKAYKPKETVELTLYRSAKSGDVTFRIQVELMPDTGR